MELTIHTQRNTLKLFIAIALMLCSFISFSQPVANFSSNKVSGCAPLTVSFQDLSTGNPTTWHWDLGNGTTSNQQSPVVGTYFNPGVYTVSLIVTNAAGSDSIGRTAYITVYDKPTANFTASTLTGCFPLNVNFTDLSASGSGTIATWSWDFGDGNNAAVQNPNYIYADTGNYSVTLKVINSNGCSAVFSRPQYIKVTPGVVANFSNPTPTYCAPPEKISFTNLSTGPATLSYQWNFGDGNTSTQTNPTNNYLTGGTYSVQLIAKSTAGCVDTLLKTDSITIKNFRTSFSGPDTVCQSVAASYSNTSSPVNSISSWTFGDGTNSALNTVTKSWSSPSTYQVKLINNFGSCIDSVVQNITVVAPPIVNFTATDSFNCKAPFTTQFTDLTTGGVKWQWNFGDGNTSILENPSHTYTVAGKFSVTLTVTNSSGCNNTLVKSQYIKIVNPTVVINTLPAGGCIPFTFKPTSTVNDPKGVAGYLWDFGDGNTSIAQTPANIFTAVGTYTVKLTVTTNDGCTDSVKGIVNSGVPTNNVNFSASPLPQCAGQKIQFTDLSSSVNSWSWNFGDGGTSTVENPLHAYVNNGTYSVQLIATNNGCPDTLKKLNYVTVLPPVAKFTPVFNCANKTIVQFTDNSVMPVTWSWNFGDGNVSPLKSPVHTYADTGSYKVMLAVTNGGCADTLITTIKVVDEHPDFIASMDSVCINSVVSFLPKNVIAANISKYIWDYGDGITSIVSVNPGAHAYTNTGTYSVTLTTTDVHGCTASVSKPNLIYVHGPIAKFSASPLIGCSGLNVIFTDNSTTDGTHPIKTWQWSYGDGSSQSQSGPPFNHIYDTAGSFPVQLKVTDSGGCFDTLTLKTPIRITQPKASFNSADSAACIGNNVTFTNSSTGVNPVTYLWTLGNGISSTQKNPVTFYSLDSDYTVKLVATDSTGCSDSLQLDNYIKVRKVTAGFTINDSVSSCSPFEVDFANTSINSTSQNWNFGDGSFSVSKNPTHYYSIPGVYIATLYAQRQGGACIDSFKRTIHLYPFNATFTYAPLTGCSQIKVNFHVSSSIPVTYFWDFGDGNTLSSTDSNIVNTYILPGSYVPKVILTDSVGCLIPLTGTDTIHLTKSNVKFGVLDSAVCSGSTNTFLDSTTSNATIVSRHWDFGDGDTAAIKDPMHSYAATGNYPVELIVNTINGCSDTLTKNISIKLYYTPKANITGDTSACVPAALTFNGVILNPDTSILTWQWHFGNGNTSNLQNPVAQSYTAAGNFALQSIASTINGCADTVNKTIIIHPLPTTDAGSYTNVCVNAPLQLQATGADSYTWLPATYLSCTNCAAPVSTPADTITYYVTGTTIYNCKSTDSVFLDVHKKFILTVTPTTDSLCSGQSVQLTAGGAENYIWSPAKGLDNNQVNNPLAAPDSTTVYTVIGYDNAHCFRDTSAINITVFPLPTVIAGPDINIPDGGSVTLSPQYSGNVTTWMWSPADSGLSCIACANPVATPARSTTYTITVANSIGCTTSDMIRINLPCEGSIFIPNTFSPNNDGANDVFYPRGKNLYLIQSMRVFDRLGETVFQRTNFAPNDASKGWDGMYGGKPAASDVYVYIIEILCDNSNLSTFKGNVTLIR